MHEDDNDGAGDDGQRTITGPVDRSRAAGKSVMARLARPRTDDDRTRLAVIADPHVATDAMGTSKLFEYTDTHLANAVADIADRDVDAVVSVGDLTKDGAPEEYAAVDEVLAELSVPFYAVPGNHDVPKAGDAVESLPVETFAERYTPESTLPFEVTIGAVDLLGVNSAGTADRLYDTHDGLVDADQRAWLRERLAAADTPVVLCHHNLPPMYEQVRAHRDAVEPEMYVPPITREGEALVDALAAAPLVFTGHLHMPSTARAGSTREVMVPTTCSFPQAYVLVTVDETGTTVEFVPVADHAGLRYAFNQRLTDSTTARGLTAMAADRLAAFPLVDDRDRE